MERHVELATSLGGTARFQHLNFTEGNKKLGSFDLELLKEIIGSIKKNNPTIQFVPELNNEQFERYYDTTKLFIRKPHECARIWTDLSIRHDGKVIMCPENELGDIVTESIIDIIKGENRKKFLVKKRSECQSKEGLPNYCSRCCYN